MPVVNAHQPLLSRRRLLAALAQAAVLAPAMDALAEEGEKAAPPKTIGPYFKTLDELNLSLREFPMAASDRRRLMDLARPTIKLTTTAIDEDAIAIGASKIGGSPDMPADMAWPMRGPSPYGREIAERLGRIQTKTPTDRNARKIRAIEKLASMSAPLAFLMQIDFAACAAAGTIDPDLPQTGRLLIFFDFVFDPWMAEQTKENSLALIYLADPEAKLARRSVPDIGQGTGLGIWQQMEDDPGTDDGRPFDRQRLPSARIDPVSTLSLPGSGSLPMLRFYPYPKDMPHAAWLEALVYSANDGCQILGWPEFIQSDPAIDRVFTELNLPNTDTTEDYAQRLRTYEALIAEWLPLVTLESYANDTIDFNGAYYVMIRRSDLKRRDFRKAFIVYQSD